MKKIKKIQEQKIGKIKPEADLRPDYRLKIPKFSFEFLENSKCQHNEKVEIFNILYQISRHTWQELIQLGKSGIGYEILDLTQIKCRIPSNPIFENLSQVTVFHKAPHLPVIGFKVHDTFYIFHIDRDYKAYKH